MKQLGERVFHDLPPRMAERCAHHDDDLDYDQTHIPTL